MKIGRYEYEGKQFYAELDDDFIYPLTGQLDSLSRDKNKDRLAASSVKVLAPVKPTKIIAIGPGTKQMMPKGYDIPERPVFFLKPAPGTITNPGDPIVYPNDIRNMIYELEIAIVISKTATRVSEEDAESYILGYTCCNDVTAGVIEEDFGKPLSYHWKAYDTFAPIGPVVVTNLGDIDGLSMSVQLNDEPKQATKVDLLYSPAKLISMVSHIMTLYPGDIISTGAAIKGNMAPGDSCTLEIEGIGTLTNHVIKL